MILVSKGGWNVLRHAPRQQRFHGTKLLSKLLLRPLSTTSTTRKQFDFEQVFKTGTPPEFFNFASDVFDSHVVGYSVTLLIINIEWIKYLKFLL